jgi:hypothetical protein
MYYIGTTPDFTPIEQKQPDHHFRPSVIALKNAEELIAKFKARCRTKLEPRSAPKRPSSVEGGLATVGNDVLGKIPHKKRRDRPRKRV